MELDWVGSLAASVVALLFSTGCEDSGQPGAPPDGGAGGTGGTGGDAQGGTGGVGGSGEPPCTGTPGTFTEQTLDVEGEARVYFLHVPPTYDCQTAQSLVMDFHGAYGAPKPELAYAHAELVALSNELGFLLVRPRARPSTMNMWDAAPTDLEDNRAFAHALLDDLASRYHIAPARRYATGYSSGSNMAASFLLDADDPFAGLGILSGALWSPGPLAGMTWSDPPRMYVATGYRDLHRLYTDAMLANLTSFPDERLWQRETDAGHVLDIWTYRELWSFFETGLTADEGVLASEWEQDTAPPGAPTLLEADLDATDRLWVADAEGSIHVREGDGTWTTSFTLSPARPISGLTIDADGGVATGLDRFAARVAGTWSSVVDAPAPADGYAFFWTTAGGDGEWLVAGSTSYASGDGLTFAELALGSYGGAQALARADNTGTTVAAGRFSFVARRPAGGSFAPKASPLPNRWLNAVAASPDGFWIAGERGTLLRSADDGQTFQAVAAPTDEDLYAIDFFDGTRGAAVGAHGTVIVTDDGGATWTDRSTGLDGFLGDVEWLDATTLTSVGEGGFIGRLALPPT